MLLNKTKIAIAGLGTVGSGVLKLFKKSLVHKKYGIELSAVASRRKLNFNDVCFKKLQIF